MKIGFYGASLCTSYDNKHSIREGYKSYIQLVQEYYNAEIIHYGRISTGYWDLILIQYKELLENKPDVAVFIWPGLGFLFNRQTREIGPYSANEDSAFKKRYPDMWPSVNLYYQNLYDREKEIVERLSAFKYFDELLSKELTDCKIIHLWEGDIEAILKVDPSDASTVGNFVAPYHWKTGSQIDAALLEFSIADQWPRRPSILKILVNDPRCNHLEGRKNNMLAGWLITAIESKDQRYEKSPILNAYYRECLAKHKI